MSIAEDSTAVIEEPKITFSESVQCDACFAAKAAWKVIGESGKSLYLCGHHKNTHEVKLLDSWAKEFIEFEDTNDSNS